MQVDLGKACWGQITVSLEYQVKTQDDQLGPVLALRVPHPEKPLSSGQTRIVAHLIQYGV